MYYFTNAAKEAFDWIFLKLESLFRETPANVIYFKEMLNYIRDWLYRGIINIRGALGNL